MIDFFKLTDHGGSVSVAQISFIVPFSILNLIEDSGRLILVNLLACVVKTLKYISHNYSIEKAKNERESYLGSSEPCVRLEPRHGQVKVTRINDSQISISF